MNEFLSCYGETHATFEDIKKKINSVRTQFFSELNKVKKSIVSGAGADDIYVPTLWCYEQLSFLNDSNETRESESNLILNSAETEVDQEIESEVLFDGPLELLTEREEMGIHTPTSNSDEPIARRLFHKKKRLSSENRAYEIMEKASSILSTIENPNQPNSAELFGM